MKYPFLKLILVVFCLPLVASLARGQALLGMYTRYTETFLEWDYDLDADESDQNQELVMTFQPDDWSQWSWRIGENSGSIRQKWRNDPAEWELTGGNQIVSARRIYSGEWREWRISDGKVTLELRCEYGNQTDLWNIKDPELGTFEMTHRFFRNPTDWNIDDQLDSEKVSQQMRILITFLVIFHSVPHR